MDAAVTPDAAFRLLTDYERVQSVFSNVLRSQTFRTVGAETRLQQVRGDTPAAYNSNGQSFGSAVRAAGAGARLQQAHCLAPRGCTVSQKHLLYLELLQGADTLATAALEESGATSLIAAWVNVLHLRCCRKADMHHVPTIRRRLACVRRPVACTLPPAAPYQMGLANNEISNGVFSMGRNRDSGSFQHQWLHSLQLQECRWEFLVFSGKFPLELTVAEQPAERRVVFSLASSPFMRAFQGTWQVRRGPPSAESQEQSSAWRPRPLCVPSRALGGRAVTHPVLKVLQTAGDLRLSANSRAGCDGCDWHCLIWLCSILSEPSAEAWARHVLCRCMSTPAGGATYSTPWR